MTIYQHYRTHEHPFVEQVLSWKQMVLDNYTYYLTDFLDPREQQILATIIGTNDDEIYYELFGGIEQSERKRAIISPRFMQLVEADYAITAIEARYNNKFVAVSHQDVLGTLMSLGIMRNKIGDINVFDNKIQMVVTEQLSQFIKMNINKINNVSVKFREVIFTELTYLASEWAEDTFTLSSLRLDVFIKEVYKMSRKDANNFIQRELVKVNHSIVADPAVQLIENDLISLRGHGRSKLVEIKGKSRKSKTIITAARLIS